MKRIPLLLSLALVIGHSISVPAIAYVEGDRDISLLIAKATEKDPALPIEKQKLITESYTEYVDLLRQSARVLEVPDEPDWAVKLVRWGRESGFTRRGNILGKALYQRLILVGLTDEATVAALDRALPYRTVPFRRPNPLYPDIINDMQPAKSNK